MLKIQLIMMKTVKLLKRNHKNSVDELKVRDTSCPKGKKVEDIQYILEQVQDSSLAKVLVKFKFIEIIQKLFLPAGRILRLRRVVPATSFVSVSLRYRSFAAKRKIEFVKKSAGAEKGIEKSVLFLVCAPWAL